jgi:hypothetical protein
MEKTTRLTSTALIGGAVCFWTSWFLMPGVGVTDATKILKLVSAQPQSVLVSSVLQLLSAALFALGVCGLSRLFKAEGNFWMSAATFLLAVGACGDAADAIYHQLAYEMVRPGIDQAAMLPVMERMQSVDLLFLLPMIQAFLAGCITLAIGSAKEEIVPQANPLLYALAIGIALAGILGKPMGLSARTIGLTCLALLSASVTWIGISIGKLTNWRKTNQCVSSL